ncbi:unnamed protein product [Hermetia illucens]|uniref:Uncharacterized protein n=1 Tax=Hermetia illucens TaxID=343691 RepID=A0A7R8YTN7_HERIL|nr:unnamed protein product [Hermetia illucens]
MPPKRQAIGRSTHQAWKKRALRASESNDQRPLRNETPGMCCACGKVKYTYNTCFQMTSFGACAKIRCQRSGLQGKFIIVPHCFYHCRAQITSLFKFISWQTMMNKLNNDVITTRALDEKSWLRYKPFSNNKTAIQRMAANNYAVLIRQTKDPLARWKDSSIHQQSMK